MATLTHTNLGPNCPRCRDLSISRKRLCFDRTDIRMDRCPWANRYPCGALSVERWMSLSNEPVLVYPQGYPRKTDIYAEFYAKTGAWFVQLLEAQCA